MTFIPNRAAHGRSVLALVMTTLLLTACAPSHYERGRRALDANRLAEALEAFETAVADDPTDFEARRDLAQVRLLGGDPEGALADLEAARALGSEDARLHWLLADALEKLGRPDEAKVALERYSALSTNRSTRSIVRLKIAQLEFEIARSQAAALRAARAQGVQPDPSSVAVYAFATLGEPASLQEEHICRALHTWVTTDLAKVKRVRVVPSDALEAIFADQKLSFVNRQRIDPSELTVGGDLHPARHMVRGLYGDQVREFVSMGASCFDAEVRETPGAPCSVQDGDRRDIFDLETALVLDILDAMSIQPTPDERLAIGVKPTRNLDAFLAYAEGVYLLENGELDRAARAFGNATSLDPGFEMAAQAAAKAEMKTRPDQSITVPAPALPDPAADRAEASAGELGLGLIPDELSGEATGGSTGDIVVTRGGARIRVTAEVPGGRAR